MVRLERDFFRQDPVMCARSLVGASFSWDGCSGVVVETEAYAEVGDAACHTFSRPSARRFVAEHDAGTAYVYLNYGVHWLTNVLVKGPERSGFVLLRALRPSSGIPFMRRRRGKERIEDLCSGPGKLSAALGIGRPDHGACLVSDPDRGFFSVPASPPPDIVTDRRVGISAATALPWRFLERDSPFVSVKPRSAAPGPETPAARRSRRRTPSPP
jgi:DNA-3-methyladenine glycosylase